MYVKKLRVGNWKNFQGGEVNLARRLFLIGPNASGKSNFLDIFRFLRDLCLSKGGGLRQAVEERGGVSAIRCLAARRYPDILIEVEIQEEGNSDGVWLYRLRFNQDNLRRPLIKEERVEYNGEVRLNRPDIDDRIDKERLTQTALEQITANKDFRAIVTFLQSISYQHLLPQVVRDPLGFSPGSIENDPFGRDLIRRVELARKTKDLRLKGIEAALKAAVPQLKEIKVIRDEVGVPHLTASFVHWRNPHAKSVTEALLSDGTLRLFGFLWSLLEGDGPVLMEEPELSLHSEVVRHLPQMIERFNQQHKIKRQVIISTHSEEMLSDSGISGDEVLRLEPSPDGTLFKSPIDSPEELELLRNGLTIADVILPKSAPANANQLDFSFS